MKLSKKILVVQRESKQIEFKQSFDLNSDKDWLEIMVRSLVAMANSGGGVIIFGLDRSGKVIGADANPILNLDPAKITDKVNAYTQSQFSDFEITSFERENTILAAILVNPIEIPMVFTREGAYNISGEKRSRIAFVKGSIYFRHGAKSEPGNSEDLRGAINRQLQQIRKEWLDGVQKIVEAPTGSQINILPPSVQQSQDPNATPIRIVDDPTVPAYYRELIR
jgi:predicted HTH transcriptional regulator